MEIQKINSENQFNSLVEKKVFVLFGGDYCPDCKQFDLLLNNIKAHNKWKELIIYYVDVTLFQELVSKEGIRSIPNLRFYKNRTFVSQLQNYSEKYLNEFISQYEN